VTLVAVDIAKYCHDVLIEPPTPGRRRRFRVTNTLEEYQRLAEYLHRLDAPALSGFEATGTYHRTLAYFLHHQGFELRLIPTLALARTRDALHNSWDKNDPKEAQVILHLLKTRAEPDLARPAAERHQRRAGTVEDSSPVTLARTPACGTACAITTFRCTSPRSNTSSAPPQRLAHPVAAALSHARCDHFAAM
jgi:transposase